MKPKSGEIERKKILMSQQLRTMLEEGVYLPGAPLPGERTLAQQYGMNRMSVKAVLQELAEDGYIYRIQGKGTFVQKKMPDRASVGLLSARGNSFSSVMKRQGIHIENQVIGRGIVPGTALLQDRLRLEKEEKIYGVHRIRVGNGVPYAVEFTYLPLKYFPDIEKQDLAHVSLYTYMESRGYGVEGGPQKLCVLPASEKIAGFLQVEVGQPLFCFEFRGLSRDGIWIEYTETYTRPDKIEVSIRAKG